MNEKLSQLANSLFRATSDFPQPGDKLPEKPDPLPPGRATVDNTETAINLIESALLEMTERQYDDYIELAINYLDEALGVLRK